MFEGKTGSLRKAFTSSSRMRGRSARDRQQKLRHLKRRKRHVILKPPGQETENGSRNKVSMHDKWNAGVLMGRGQFALIGPSHFCKIPLDQLLKPANPLSTQHQLVKVLMCCRMLKQTKKIGRRMLSRERAG